MLPKGCVQADGSLLVTSSDPEGTATEDIIYVNGLPVNNLGQLQVSIEPIVSYAMGLPFDADGKLVVQDVAVAGTGDSYVGGLRVGTDGIHMDDSADVGTADSFNGGIRCTAAGAVYVLDSIPNRSDLVYYARSPGMVDSIGMSFTGTWPNVTMTLTTGAPIIGIGPFLVDHSYYIPDLPNNIDNQFFWGEDKGILAYSVAQTDTIAKKALSYLRESFWTDGLVSALDVFNTSINRGVALTTSYAGDQYLDGVSIGANPAVSSKGLDIGPAYTNLAPVSLAKDAATTENSGWYDFSALADGGYGVFFNYSGSLGSDASKTFTAVMTAEFAAEDVGLKIKYRIVRASGTAVLTDAEHTIVEGINTIGPVSLTQLADSYGVRFVIVRETDAGYATKIEPISWQLVQSSFSFPIIPPGATKASSAATSGGNGASLEMDDKILGALAGVGGQPAELTVMNEMFMGVGSGELVAGNYNVFSVMDATGNIKFSESQIYRVYDGTNVIGINATWNSNEVHKRVIQSNASGFRVGYRRFEDDGITPLTDWVWSAYVAFDGSFNPLTWLRFGYLNTVPLWLRKNFIWQRGDVTEAELNAPLGSLS